MDVAIMLAIETEDWNTVDGLLEEVSKTVVVMPRHKAIKLQLLLLVQIKRLASKPYILDKHIHEVHIHSSQITEYEPLMDKGRLLAIKYELGVLYFTNVSYFAEASYWFNQIALGHREKRRKDIQKNVRIFDVICQIEFGNITLFSSKIATLRKFIGRNLNLTSQLNAQREFDQEVMRNLRSISNQLENGKDAAKHYKQLFEIALKAYHQHSASGLYNAAEIMLWIAGKYPELRNKLPD
jgi:hypothetical protein